MMLAMLVGAPALRAGTVLRMSAAGSAAPVLTPRKDGIRRTLSTTGSPVPVGGAPPPDERGWFDGETLGSCVVKRFTDENRVPVLNEVIDRGVHVCTKQGSDEVIRAVSRRRRLLGLS